MNKINFQNLPNTTTPVNATNLNQLQTNVENAINGVVESGSNTNGKYIKFSDGTMICTKTVDLEEVPIDKANGSLFVSETLSLGSYAESFVGDLPTLQLTLSRYSAQGFIYQISAVGRSTIGSIVVGRGSSSASATLHIDVVAVGRWK